MPCYAYSNHGTSCSAVPANYVPQPDPTATDGVEAIFPDQAAEAELQTAFPQRAALLQTQATAAANAALIAQMGALDGGGQARHVREQLLATVPTTATTGWNLLKSLEAQIAALRASLTP